MANPTPTIADVQEKLTELTFYNGDIDGLAGPKTAAAVVAFQKSKGLTETGKLDNQTLAALFPSTVANRPTGIQATLTDWVLNFVQSKINQVAAAGVALAVAWIATKFGFDVPPDVQQWVERGIVVLAGSIMVLLRGLGKDTPRVTAKSPAVIQQPAKFVGETK